MLSNKTCTNHTGSHRRQYSTPNLSASSQPTPSSKIPQQEAHRRGQSLDQISFPITKEEIEQARSDDIRELHRQQDRRQSLQETQQAAAGPGQQSLFQKSQHSDYPFNPYPPTGPIFNQPCLCTKDLNALMTGLSAQENLSDNEPPDNHVAWMNAPKSNQSLETKNPLTGVTNHDSQRLPSNVANSLGMPHGLPFLCSNASGVPPDWPGTHPNQNFASQCSQATGINVFD